jgi:hypothetical protein
MPIRWNRRVGRRGKVSARLADWTASLAGTSYLASNNSGRIQVQLYDWTGAIRGAVTSAATFRGVIAAQLENWTANIVGTRNRPPVWTPATPVTINVTSTSPVGTVVVDLAAAGALYATDPDGDALTFTAQNLPSWLTLLGSQVRVAQPLTIGASANVTGIADDGVLPPADWTARSTAPGVVWAQRFNTSASDYWIDPGAASASSAVVRRIATDGVQGDGCLEVFVPAGSDPGNGSWTRPLAPVRAFAGHYAADVNVAGLPVIPFDTAFSTNDRPSERLYNMRGGLFGASQYFNSTQIQSGFPEFVYAGKFWIQMRVKLSASRIAAAEHAGKIFNIDQAGNDTCMHEFVTGVEGSNLPGAPAMPYFYTAQGNRTISRLHNPQGQTASAVRQPAIPACAYSAGGTLNSAACWQWPADTWVTVNIGIGLGSQNTTADNGFTFPSPIRDTSLTIRVAEDGATSWTTLCDKSDFYWWYSQVLGSSFSYGAASNGLQKLVLYAYNGGTSQTPAVADFYHRFDEIICSTQEPALPSGVAQAQSVLADAADALASGSWSGHVLGAHSNTGGLNVVVPAMLYAPTLTHEVSIPGADTMLAWSGKALWNPALQRLIFSGGPVGNTYNVNHPGSSILQYDEVTDRWLVNHGTSGSLDGMWGRWAHAHNFDAADYDDLTGHVFRHLSGGGAPQFTWYLGRFDPVTRAMVNTPIPALSWPSQAYPSCVMLRSQRKFLALFPGSTWQVYDVASWPNSTTAWSTKAAPANFNSGLSVYHNGYAYMTQGNVYQGTGGTGLERKGFYRVKDDATWQTSLETLADTPVGTSIGESENDTFHGMLCALGSYLYLLSGNGRIYRYDIAGNVWTDLGAIIPNINPNRTDELMHCTAVAIPEHGVIAVLHGYDINYSTAATCQLWKP